MTSVDFIQGPGKTTLAYRQDGPVDDQSRCGFFWLGGFRSDMRGSKAEALAALARDTRRPSLRFDYAGHGESAGRFEEGTISAWLEQSIHMFITKTQGKRIIIGSSMGGWLALLLVKTLLRDDPAAVRRIAGLILIAPAADMTLDLMWNQFSPQARDILERQGFYLMPSAYGAPYAITARLISDGNKHLVLKQGLEVNCPVRIIQGTHDPDVSPAHAGKVFEALTSPDITMSLLKGGDHRLSTPHNLNYLKETALQLALRADGLGV